MNNFMEELKKSADQALDNVSVTENGAVGYKTSGEKLLDLNFALSSMRNWDEKQIWDKFLAAYNENPALAVLWLFFARDREEGCGERRAFRVIFDRLCRENEGIACRLLPLIPFYGRWDDVVAVLCSNVPRNVRDEAFALIEKQISDDLDNAKALKPVSLLAKWLPSLLTSSRQTRMNAELIRNLLGLTPKQYRKILSRLRSYIGVVEKKMSSNEWGQINYERVPSRASLIYRDAFARHDGERYHDYLENVKEGKAKINASVLFPHDIVSAYRRHGDGIDNTLEEQWKALPDTVPDNASTLVVVDGSYSMYTAVGNTGVTCLDVSYALGMYFAEKLKGPYYNSFITFSACPQFVHFADGLTLRARIDIMKSHDDCSNTDIEKVFDMVLDTAVRNHLKQDELPANILVVSDMEFDAATYRGGYGWNGDFFGPVTETLFDSIRDRWEAAGYKLPRLVFWNVCSRTNTIPVSTNELGVALVSGFSPNIADIVMSGDLNPYKCLVDKLLSDRYRPVADALKE